MAKIIELKGEIIEKNAINAQALRDELTAQKKLMINVMSSPGSGKTTVLSRTISALQPDIKIGVMECDIDASVDAERIEAIGARSIQLHTDGMCHMDSAMTAAGLSELGTDGLDLIFIENVGNLVCPAEFDTGAQINISILSVPEGDDKPAKYPLMYEVCSVVLINKIDAMEVFDFDCDLVVERIHKCNPDAKVFFVSAKTGEGFDQWTCWLKEKCGELKAE